MAQHRMAFVSLCVLLFLLSWCCTIRAENELTTSVNVPRILSEIKRDVVNTTLYHQCTTIGTGVISLPVCIDILLNNSCIFIVRITVSGVPFERQFKGALPPEICIDQGLCQVCIRFDDLTAQAGCVVLAMVCQGIEVASAPLDCFSIPVGPCLSCPNGCSDHGDCNNGACICDNGYTGEDCSVGHPGAFWKQCIGLSWITSSRICLELGTTICDMNIALSTENQDGSNNHMLYQTSVHIEEFELNPEAETCYSLLGCELCIKLRNFTVNEATHLASACPVLSAECFGSVYPPTQFDCFRETGILGSCADCPDNCNGPTHGECTNGICHCKDGWLGVACAYKDCIGNCSGHGTCELGKCVCTDGWSGESCALECPDRSTSITQLKDGLLAGLTLNAGESMEGYVVTRMNLAGLTFAINPTNNVTMNAYARRNCYANAEYHDAKKLGIVYDPTYREYYGAGSIFHAVQDCYMGWRGDRWFLNLTCNPCATCEQRCKFDLGVYIHYVEKIVPGVSLQNISILPSQRHHYSIHIPQPTQFYLSLNIAQTPTDDLTRLSLISLQEDRCPTEAPFTASVSKPVSSMKIGDHITHKFFLVKEGGLKKGDYFIRVDGCQDTNTHRCGVMNYSLSAYVGNGYCVDECKNGGRCSGINACDCRYGWGGPVCDIPHCQECKQGTCVAPDKCTCDAGWSGPSCDQKSHKEKGSIWDKTSIALGVVAAFGFAAAVSAGITAFHFWRKRNRPNGYGLMQFQELDDNLSEM